MLKKIKSEQMGEKEEKSMNAIYAQWKIKRKKMANIHSHTHKYFYTIAFPAH